MQKEQTSGRSFRWELFSSGLRRLFSFAGLLALARRPRTAYDFIRAMLFDVKLRAPSPASRIASLTGSVDALARLSHLQNAPIVAQNIAGSNWDVSGDADCEDLAALFRSHGSDKATAHDYHLVYAALLKGRRQEPLRILEIGLGTNNIDTASNMGASGRPGASLRAFRDWAPKSTVVGADVDRRVLFSEDRITTYYVDQTSPETIESLARNFPAKSFDLVIDDGLHTPEANLNAIAGLLGLVKNGGWMVIEDVDPESLNYWQTAFSLLATSFSCTYFKAKGGDMCLIQPTCR